MLDKDLEEMIATRTFESDEGELIVKIGKPIPDEADGGDWKCPLKVGEDVKYAFGIDSYQALINALFMASVQLEYLNKTKSANIQWLGMNDLMTDMDHLKK